MAPDGAAMAPTLVLVSTLVVLAVLVKSLLHHTAVPALVAYLGPDLALAFADENRHPDGAPAQHGSGVGRSSPHLG